MKREVCGLFLTAGLVAFAGPTAAQNCAGTHCDILPARLMITGELCDANDPNGLVFDPSQTAEYSRLVTGARDLDAVPIATLYPTRAFDQRLNGSFQNDDPGFRAIALPCTQTPELSPLPGTTGLHFDFLTEPTTAGGAEYNLLWWDGVDDDMNGLDPNDVDWSAVPMGEVLHIDRGIDTVTADGGTDEVEGLLIDSTGSTGSIHSHVDFRLRRSGGPATLGVYLVKLDLTMPGFAEGAPTFLAFGTISIPAATEAVARMQVDDELVQPLCNDGVDNDRDGFVDFAGGDPGCSSALDESEKSVLHECDDGIDNDMDGKIDYRAVDFGSADLYANRDPQCDSPTDATGEATAVPALPAAGLVTFAVLLMLAAWSRLNQRLA